MKRAPIVFVAVLALLVAVPLTGSHYWVYALTIVAIYTIAVAGLNVVMGYAGQISFATTTFMAVGGYTSAIGSKVLHWNPWLALLVGLLLSALVAALVGIPLLRLRGHYLAMGTFALGMATYALAVGAVNVTGGAIGIPGVPPLAVGPIDLSNPLAFYSLGWIVAGAVLLGVARLSASRVGRAWRALATREDVATSLGVDVSRYKQIAFVISAVLGALSGSLYVEFTSFAAPDLYDVNVIVRLFTMLFIGGIASAYGAPIGAAIVVIVPILMGPLQNYQMIVFDVLLLVVLIVRPQGVVGRLRLEAPLRAILPRALTRRISSGGARS